VIAAKSQESVAPSLVGLDLAAVIEMIAAKLQESVAPSLVGLETWESPGRGHICLERAIHEPVMAHALTGDDFRAMVRDAREDRSKQ
jgi:hypothetical protein